VWQGTVSNIPAGTERVIEGFAYDAASVLIYRGSTGPLSIGSGSTVSANLMLQQVNPTPPYQNEAPRIESVVVSTNRVPPGGSLTLTATAQDPNGDALSYAWTASAGTFSAPASATTSWTAPATEGVQRLVLQVTDARGTSTSVSLDVSVQRDGATGDAQVTIGFNTWPEIRTMQGTPTSLTAGGTTSLSVSAVDADGDALSASWATDCRGTFANPMTFTPTFTLETMPTTGRCAFRVTLSDGKGGQHMGTLVLQAGSGPLVNVAPKLDNAYQSSTLAGAGELVTLGVAAHDPEGKPVSFSWSASSGTLQANRWTSTSSEVDWSAPACFDNPISLVVTVKDADGASASQTFSIAPRESAKCGALAVSGVRNIHNIQADGSLVTTPDDLSAVTLGAWVPTVDGLGYEYRAGAGQANGTFVIPNVERTPFLFRFGAGYFWANSRTLDLSYASLGRPDVEQEPVGTQLAFELDGLAPWQDVDDLQLHSWGTGMAYFSLGCSSPYLQPEPGSTSVTGAIDYTTSMRNCGNVPARIDPARGDSLLATQLVNRSDLDAGIPSAVDIQELRRAVSVSRLLVADGGTSTDGGTDPTLVLKGTMSPLPTTRQAIDFRASQFESQVLATNPTGVLYSDILYVSTLPRFMDFGQYDGFPDLAVASNYQPGQGDLSLAVEYGNPYPSQWDRIITAQANALVPFTTELADGGVSRTARYSATTYSQTPFLEGMRPTIVPRVGPPRSPRINGQTTMAGKLTGVGLTPLVSWSVPSLGTPNRYQVRVYEIFPSATGGTSRLSVASLLTSQTQLRLPPNLLVAGKTYFLQLTAYYTPGTDPNAPYLYKSEYHYATTLTGQFQP
jgi:hypothetical protein